MAAGVPAGPWVVLIVSLVLATGGVWWWRSTVFQTARDELTPEPWQHVLEQYPIPADPEAAPNLSPETFEAVVSANPFSPVRRIAASPGDGGQTPGADVTPPEVLPPKFVYKGLITMGPRRRAIVEDVTAHKTHFLEVGQEVAGFKVLDIAENRVVLSDPKTHEEVIVSVTSKATLAP